MTDALTTDEFDDAGDTGIGHVELSAFDLAVLRHPVVVRAVIGVGVALAIVIWPDRTDRILARLIGAGLLGLGAVTTWTALTARPVGRVDALLGAAAAVTGVVLLIAPQDRSSALLGRLLAVVALAAAVRGVVGVLRGREADTGWAVARSAALAGLGLLLAGFPTALLSAVVAAFGVGWAVLGLLALARSMDPTVDGIASYRDAGELVVAWLEDRPKSADDRQALYAKILFDGPGSTRRIVRFFTLMGFSAVIAATGIVGDSTAVVIGAMLIAPLMTPLMGMAISLVMGWPRRLGRSAAVAGSGIVLAVAVGLVIGLVSPTVIDTASNGQILSRSSPTTLDLLIAVAAGAAGAYGLSRPDVSDALPGVAIAISLVPPLSVVGISYSQGDWRAGSGALLLFATNMLAILLVGGVLFVLTGVTPLRRLTDNQHRTRTAMAGIAGVATLVLGALLLNGAQVARDVTSQGDADDAVERWLEPHPGHDSVRTDLDGDTVTAVIIGPSDGTPPAEPLADELSRVFGRPITAVVRLVVEERDEATGSP